MARKKYTYIPNDEIESLTTWNGKEIKGSDLLDGAYVRGKKSFADGGDIKYEKVIEQVECEVCQGDGEYFEEDISRYVICSNCDGTGTVDEEVEYEIEEEPMVTRQMFEEEAFDYKRGGDIVGGYPIDKTIAKTKKAIKYFEGLDDKESKKQVANLKDYLAKLEKQKRESYKKGGVTRNRKKSLEEKAQEIVGTATWHSLDKETKAGIISEMVTEGVLPQRMAKGSVVSNKMSVTFTLADGKKETREYSSKEEMDEGIADMYMSFDVEDVKVNEVKEEVKEKKSLFSMAKEKPTAAKSSKSKYQQVEVPGIGGDLERYKELHAIIKNAEAEKEILSGRLYEIGKDKFMEMYLENRRRPENFKLADAGEDLLFIMFDKYKMVTPEKEEILEKFKDVLGIDVKYTFDKEILEKTNKNGELIGDVINELIMNSDDIPEEDKENLIVVEKKVGIKKGTIDRLMD
jgi:hypothetical protein